MSIGLPLGCLLTQLSLEREKERKRTAAHLALVTSTNASFIYHLGQLLAELSG